MPDFAEILGRLEGWAGYLLLFFSAAIEYVFPPFPGDAAVLFGVFLAVWRGWNVPAVFFATFAGAVTGAAITWRIGWWLGGVDERKAGGFFASLWPSPDRFRRFSSLVQKYGPAVIISNRFFPGLRAFFILAAGMARIPFWKCMGYAAVSALMWNAVLFAFGKTVGDNWVALRNLFKTYTFVAVGVACVIIAALIAAFLRRNGSGDAR